MGRKPTKKFAVIYARSGTDMLSDADMASRMPFIIAYDDGNNYGRYLNRSGWSQLADSYKRYTDSLLNSSMWRVVFYDFKELDDALVGISHNDRYQEVLNNWKSVYGAQSRLP